MTHLYMPREVAPKAGKAMLRDAPVSPKVAIEVANHLRGMKVEQAIRTLENVLAKKEAIPYRRFTNAIGHRVGPIASGRFPQKASEHFLKLIKNAKANASNAGLTGDLVVSHLAVNRAAENYRGRSKFRHQAKRAHLECIVTEAPAPRAKKKRVAPKKEAAKQD